MGEASSWIRVVVLFGLVACKSSTSTGTPGSAAGTQAAGSGGTSTSQAGAGGGVASSQAGGGSAAAGAGPNGKTPVSADGGSAGVALDAGGSAHDSGASLGDGGAAIPCTHADWITQCGSSCPFPAADIDCAAACSHLPTVCTANCAQCMGVNLDSASCMAGCAVYKGVTCYNRLLGCFVSNTTCESVTACANAHQ